MSRYARRSENTRWSNDIPISDLYEALDLFLSKKSSTEPHHLALRLEDGQNVPEIVCPWYSTRRERDSSGCRYFKMTAELADLLIKEHYIRPHRILYMGGSHEDNTKLVITDWAREKVCQYLIEQETRARKLLIPGVHTDLTGVPEMKEMGRTEYSYGRLYFDFTMPSGETCRVFPENGSIVVLEY